MDAQGFNELPVQFIASEELPVGTGVTDLSSVQDHDLISIENDGQPVGCGHSGDGDIQG